jgi:hypothetical protein
VMDAKCRQRPTAAEWALVFFVARCGWVWLRCTHSRTWYHSVVGLRGVERAVSFVDSVFESFFPAAASGLGLESGIIAQAHRRVSLAMGTPVDPASWLMGNETLKTH